MDVCKCRVYLSGSKDMAVARVGVTPAEIVLLRIMHGDDAVVDITVTGHVSRSNYEEKDRLSRIYKAKLPDEESLTFVDKVFPGYDPRLPQEVRELGLDEAFFGVTSRVREASPMLIEDEEPAPAAAPVTKPLRARRTRLVAGERPVMEIETPDLDEAMRAAAEKVPEPVQE